VLLRKIKEAKLKDMLMKILLEAGYLQQVPCYYFDESEAEKFIKLYIKRGRKSLSESFQCVRKISVDLLK